MNERRNLMSRPGEIDVKDFIKQKKDENRKKIPMLNANFCYKTPNEYADFIGKHPVTIFKWLAAGRIEGAVKVGRNWKIPIKT
jgi:hypothetical protein